MPPFVPTSPLTPTVLVFDSGLGGMTVLREIVKARPDAAYLYVADDAFFPYGERGEADLIERVIALMAQLIAAHHPDLVAIACNTASTLVLPHLRARFPVPFVGTVPAIKPACLASTSKLVSVLGTKATVAREYTHALIHEFGQGCDVNLVGSPNLAALAERALNGEVLDDADILREVMPCFIEKAGRRTDAIVLACTHFPLLLERLARLAPWPVAWVDPAPAIARRIADLIGTATQQARSVPVSAEIVFTSGRTLPPPVAAALLQFGIATLDRCAAAE